MNIVRYLQQHDKPWSPITTEESVKVVRYNYFAISETLTAIIIFFVVAVKWKTLSLLYSSLAVAPFLLLRSDASVATAVAWFEKGAIPLNANYKGTDISSFKRSSGDNLLIAIISLASSGLVVCLGFFFFQFVDDLFSNFSVWVFGNPSMGFVAATLGFIVLATSTACAVGALVFGPLVLKSVLPASFVSSFAYVALSLYQNPVYWKMPLFLGMLFIIVAVVSISSLFFGLTAIGLAIDAATVVASPGSIAGQGKLMAARISPGAKLLVGAPALGILLVSTLLLSFLAKFFATCLNLYEGYKSMPQNFWRLALATSWFHIPELVPGLPPKHNFRMGQVFEVGARELSSHVFLEKIYGISWLIVAFFLFLPSLLYRFVLKSTFWLWWLVVILGGVPDLGKTTKMGVGRARAKAYLYLDARLYIILSTITITGILFGFLIKPLLNNYLSAFQVPFAVIVLFLAEWDTLSLFRALSLVTSVFTLFIWKEAFNLNIDFVDVGEEEDKILKKLVRLGYHMKAQRVFGIISLSLLIIYICIYYLRVKHNIVFDDWLFRLLKIGYGEYADIFDPKRNIQ